MLAISTLTLVCICLQIDDADDSDVLERVEEFHTYVSSLLRKEGMWEQPVEFVSMSSLHSYLYRWKV